VIREQQHIAPRERELGGDRSLGASLGWSVALHLAFILAVAFIGSITTPPRMVTPGYKVTMVDLNQVQRLAPRKAQKKQVAKPKKKIAKKRVKTTKKVVKKKIVKKKKAPVKKKVVPKKESPKPKREPVKKVRPRPLPETAPKPRPLPEPEVAKAAALAPAVLAQGVEFPYTWYLTIIEKKIEGAWVTHGIDPFSIRREPVVSFVIARDGTVGTVVLQRGSGSDELDQSALDAVKGIKGFGALPDEYPEETLLIHFSFTYAEK